MIQVSKGTYYLMVIHGIIASLCLAFLLYTKGSFIMAGVLVSLAIVGTYLNLTEQKEVTP